MKLPFGFEEFGHLKDIIQNFSVEALEENGKELALISAPSDVSLFCLSIVFILLS